MSLTCARYVCSLLASLTPFQGQAALVTPPPSFSGSNYLAHTYTLEKGPYLMFTPSAGIVLGLPYVVAFAEGIGEKRDVWEVTDDSYVKPELKKCENTSARNDEAGADGSGSGLYEYCGKAFDDWGDEAPGEGGTRVWSGIQCASRDTLPLVGAVPGRKGLWVNVGHHGHGMGRIPFITRSLARTITTGQWDGRLPSCFEITEERLVKGQTAPPFITDEEMRGETVPTAGRTGDGAKTVNKGGWWSGVRSFVR
jgi:glycine/D-amino acid oxidase-like deaminating enzyme